MKNKGLIMYLRLNRKGKSLNNQKKRNYKLKQILKIKPNMMLNKQDLKKQRNQNK